MSQFLKALSQRTSMPNLAEICKRDFLSYRLLRKLSATLLSLIYCSVFNLNPQKKATVTI
jgi:hypothetical protein